MNKTNAPHRTTKTVARTLAVGALALAASQPVNAQYAPPPPPAPFPGFLNEWLRKDDPYMAAWDFGGQSRSRFEYKVDGGTSGGGAGLDFRKTGVDNNNEYFMEKVRVRAGYTGKWFNVFVEGRHSSTTGDERGPHAGPESDGPLDLHQAFIGVGNHKEFPLSVKVGRQELVYGDERLVGAAAWNNIGRVFDAAKMRWQNPWFGADFFTGRAVIPNDNNFNVVNDYDWFSGMYATTKLIPKTLTDFYFLSRNVSASSLTAQRPGNLVPFASPRDIYTVGMRFKSATNEFGNWDYTVDVMGQFGHFNDTRAGVPIKSQEQEAYAFVAQGGYTFAEAFGTPRVALEYSYASGDSDPKDGKHGTFENLFPTNHKFYGYMDFFSLQNIQDVRAIFQLKPHPRVSTALEAHGFWLADTHDNLYNVAGAPRGGGVANAAGYGVNSNYGSYVGSEVDLIVGYALTRYAQLEAGFGHFFTGDYVDSSLKGVGGSKDANYVYLQLTVNF